MMELIDRAAAIEVLGEPHPLDYNRISAVEKIRSLPTVPAAPIMEGEWERMKGERDVMCSVCKARFNPDIRFLTDSQIRFCPHCGAKVVKVKWT